MLSYVHLTGADILIALDAVARLRIEVFRDYPYLYDGTLEYERDYLATFAKADGAIVILARDGERVVGASTGCSLASEHASFVEPFRARGLDVASIFYCAESVLLKPYRGQGAGKRFFALRESHGRGLGHKSSAFCAVKREDNYPMRPVDYQSLDGFWRSLGYEAVEGLQTSFAWTDVGDSHETEKQLQVWMKPL
jgi:GNAT superfamily N-acetyltransferase